MTYKAIFFDLDGTLLPLDADRMIKTYFRVLPVFLKRIGYEDPEPVTNALGMGTRAVALSGPDRLNEEVFWEVFCETSGIPREVFEAQMDEFYRTDFNLIGEGIVPNERLLEAVRILDEKGYELFITTMPLFPRIAIEQRLFWAGLDPELFSRITTYENSYEAKPEVGYYLQNIALAGVSPEEVLVVGNHMVEDLAATVLGCDAFLVTDMLIDGIGVIDRNHVTAGSSEDFLAFVKALPACGEDPR